MRRTLLRLDWPEGQAERAARALVEAACDAASAHASPPPSGARVRRGYALADRDERIAALRAQGIEVAAIAARSGLSERQTYRVLAR